MNLSLLFDLGSTNRLEEALHFGPERRLSDESCLADDSTLPTPTRLRRAAAYVGDAGRDLRGTLCGFHTLRLISFVVAPCCSTAAAIAPEISDILLMVPAIS